MSKAIDQDIENTLYKLHTLLQYSNYPKAGEVYDLISKAKVVWEGEKEEEEVEEWMD